MVSLLLDEMIAEMNKPEYREYVQDLSSDKYGVDKSRIPAKDSQQETASYRKLNVD